MPRFAAKDCSESAVSGTLPEAARRFGLGVKLIRRKAREGAFPVFDADTRRPRVFFADVERWLRSTRVRVGPTAHAHAKAVVSEVLGRGADV